MEAQARLRYHNGQKQDEEYWVLKKVELCGCGQCGGGLVVTHVDRRLLLGRTPRQSDMSHHNDNFQAFTKYV